MAEMVKLSGFIRSTASAAALAAACFGMSGTAFAQQAAAAETDANDAGEIVVTANKRLQSLSDVGMSITALTGDTLADRRVNSPMDLGSVVPGLTVQPTPLASPVYTLRGVGFYETTLSASPTVAVYVDEVVIPFSAETRGIAFDVQRVEVLKGPQGTLFGANTTGGAINYIANKPTDQFAGGLDASFARFGTAELSGFLNIPVSDTLKMRFAGRLVHGGSWQKSYTRDDKIGRQRQLNGRLIADWAPSDRFKLVVTATGWTDTGDTQQPQYLSGSCRPGVVTGACDPANRWQQNYQNYPQAPKTNRAADWGATIYGGRPKRDDWFWLGSARADYELTDDVALTSITAYSKFKTTARQDFDGTAFIGADILSNGRIKTFSQELRLSGKTDRLNWIVGGNYDKSNTYDSTLYGISEQGGYPFYTDPGPQMETGSQAVANQKVRNAAVFANGEFEIVDALTLIGGVRYTKTKRSFDGCSVDPGDNNFSPFWNRIFAFANLNLGPGDCFVFTENFPEVYRDRSIIDSLSEDNISWNLGVNYKLDGGALLYARVSRGYKAGSYPNVQAAAVAQYRPVKQESLLAYEVGFKAPFLDRRANISAAVFYYDYTDKQLKGRAPDAVFRDLDALVQIPKSEVKGAEVEINLRPVDGLRLFGGATYIHSRIKDYNAVVAFGGAPLDFSGQAFPYSPKLTMIGDVQYDFPISSNLNAYVGASATYNSRTSAVLRNRNTPTIARDSLFDIKGYTLIDLRAGVSSADDRWTVYAFGRNITNKYYWTNVLDNVSSIVRYTGRPRTYGVGVRHSF
jgi:outer membrane receptor protein involved in Fe transport